MEGPRDRLDHPVIVNLVARRSFRVRIGDPQMHGKGHEEITWKKYRILSTAVSPTSRSRPKPFSSLSTSSNLSAGACFCWLVWIPRGSTACYPHTQPFGRQPCRTGVVEEQGVGARKLQFLFRFVLSQATC